MMNFDGPFSLYILRVPKTLWTCPRCRHKFVTRNLWHSCGRYRVEAHFAGTEPVVRRVYRKVVTLVRACGPVTIYAQKSRIVCMVRVRFAAFVVRKGSLICALWLTRRAEHPAIVRLEGLGPRSFANSFRFTDPAQVDDAFVALLRAVYAAHGNTK